MLLSPRRLSLRSTATDFAARNETFHSLMDDVAARCFEVLESDGEDAVRGMASDENDPVNDMVIGAVTKIRENIVFRRADALTGDIVGTYTHNALGGRDNIGGICAAVALQAEGEANKDNVEALAKQIAMHVVAASPQFPTISAVPEEAVEK